MRHSYVSPHAYHEEVNIDYFKHVVTTLYLMVSAAVQRSLLTPRSCGGFEMLIVCFVQFKLHPAKKVFEHLRYFVSKNLY